MKIVTKATLYLRPNEKYFLEVLKNMCETKGCEDCPLQEVCEKHFKEQTAFEDFLNSVLEIAQEDKER